MEKKVLEIQDFEDKKTNSGKNYTRFKTNEGWMSCFDSKSANELKKLQGSSANVETTTSGDFTNIKKFISPASESANVEPEKPGKVAENSLNGKFPVSMKVAYAKDCFCSIVGRISQAKFDDMEPEEVIKLMDLAITAVKKAENAFK